MIRFGNIRQGSLIDSLSKSFGNVLTFGDSVGGKDGFFSIVRNLLKYYTHSGMTDEKKEEMSEQDKYLDENREQDYEITKRGWEEMYSPEATLKSQAAGLDAVGINRMALAGNVTSGASASTPSPSQPSASGGSGDPVAALMSVVGGFAQVRDITATAELKKSQKSYQDIVNKWKDKQEEADYNLKLANTELVGANVVKISEDAKVAAVYAKFAPQLFGSQVALNDANAQKAIADADKSYSDIQLNDAEMREFDARVKKYGKEMEEIDKKMMLIEQQCIESASQSYLNDARAQEAYQNVTESEERVKKLMKEMGFLDKEIEYYIWNHPRTSGAAGFRWNTSSDNGRSRSDIEQYSDEDIMRAARARGLISE